MKVNLIMAALVASVVSCNSASVQVDDTPGSELGFSLNFFKKAIDVSDKDANVTVSPYSAGVALSMLMQGAEGETKVELDNALNGCIFTNEEIDEGEDIVVKTANSVWLDDDFAVRNSYVNHLSKEYDALVTSLSFADPETVHAINNWCSEHTEGLINGIIDKLTPQMKMVLANALYFKAEWMKTFNAPMTRSAVFHGSKGDSDVLFMSKKDSYMYAEYYGNQLIELPYAGEKYSMYILLPSKDLDVNDIFPYLNEVSVKDVVGMMDVQQVSLKLPKFKLETEMSLVNTLENMGVRTAFTSAADLSGISQGPLAVSDILHKTVVDVNENGTEAAAVTAVMVALTSARPSQPKVMEVNRPFIYMIADMETGRILFSGRVMNL